MKTQDLISYIEDGRLNDKLLDIYLDESLIAYQTERYIKAIKSYEDTFKSTAGYNDDVCIINAPGRTEIGGNHTDHQHGHVLTASINLDTIAVVAKKSRHDKYQIRRLQQHDKLQP
ncbi:galactokinase family protein [Butyrivibrio sp. AE3003]|uniref:galactokinase family protein n=1 Tax=Butyrivibrio sp. AE3003 TaxID=1496721 RepID=UPI000B1F2B62|nr:galactokinase family protein [Butyrivibrio sp. AE3003]